VYVVYEEMYFLIMKILMKQEIKLEEYIPPGCNLVVAWTLNPT
jgi:hypothetical protein